MIILFISQVHFLREALIEVLRGGEGIMAFGAFSRETAEAVTTEFTPNLVVIDSSHPEAMALVSIIRTRLPKVGVVVLATRERDEDFLLWADIGISGYLGPDTSSRDLISTVRRAPPGALVWPPPRTPHIVKPLDRSNDRATRAGIHALTPREREIMELLADGLPNKLIARRLQVALPTVKNHVHSILDKWDVRSRGEAAARYRRKIQETEASSSRFTAVRPIHVLPTGLPAHRNGSASSAAGRRAG